MSDIVKTAMGTYQGAIIEMATAIEARLSAIEDRIEKIEKGGKKKNVRRKEKD